MAIMGHGGIKEASEIETRRPTKKAGNNNKMVAAGPGNNTIVAAHPGTKKDDNNKMVAAPPGTNNGIPTAITISSSSSRLTGTNPQTDGFSSR